MRRSRAPPQRRTRDNRGPLLRPNASPDCLFQHTSSASPTYPAELSSDATTVASRECVNWSIRLNCGGILACERKSISAPAVVTFAQFPMRQCSMLGKHGHEQEIAAHLKRRPGMMKPEEAATTQLPETVTSGSAGSSRSIASLRQGGVVSTPKGMTARAEALRVKAKRISHRRQIRRSHANG
jgi:hypothetical protein